jgi:hypothetical protein
MKNQDRLEKTFAIVGSVVGICTVCFQLVLFIQLRTASVGEVLIRFFSYFTILSNIAVTICFFARAFTGSKLMLFWKKSDTKTAIAIYIFIVALLYNLVLRALWVPIGLQRWVDEMLHVLMPLLFLVYWWLFTPTSSFSWHKVARCMCCPFIYFVLVMLRGNFSNWYPYPFLDAFNHGYSKIGVAIAALLLVFFAMTLLFNWVLSIKTKKNSP